MARPLQIEYPDAFSHVMNRGQSRRNIFLEYQGRQSFLDLQARRGERGADGSHLSRPAIRWAQARGDWKNGGTMKNVIGELGLFTDEGANSQRKEASPEGSEN